MRDAIGERRRGLAPVTIERTLRHCCSRATAANEEQESTGEIQSRTQQRGDAWRALEQPGLKA